MKKRSCARLKALAWKLNATKLKIKSRFRLKSSKVQKIESTPKPEKRFKQGWREVGGRKIYFRSKWEANFGRYLEWQKNHKMILDWLHEPQTFWFDGIRRGCVSYLPDFKVFKTDGTYEWIEVKGFMDSKSRTKINRFRKYFPKESLRIVGAKWYKENKKKMSALIQNWEK